MTAEPGRRFQAGGTLRPDAWYMERAADRALYEGLRVGEPCYVLAPRQIGKSSLRLRVQERLRADGWRCVSIDITALGQVERAREEDWYGGLLAEIADQLGREAVLGGAGPVVKRFQDGLRRVLEPETLEVALFLDEIDALRRAGIDHEGFLAALRAICNLRAEDAVWRRLHPCLLGVATPGELIDDPQRTPFNLGREVRLDDFSEAEVAGFASGLLGVAGDRAEALALLGAVYRRTEGHPYLTQRLCEALVAEGPRAGEPAARVQALEERILYGRQADTNLSYADRRFLDEKSGVPLSAKVGLYRRLLLDERVAADRQSRLHSELRLAGLIKDTAPRAGEEPVLRLRNPIVARLFDLEWVNGHSEHARLAELMLGWKRADRDPSLLLRDKPLADALTAVAGADIESDLAEYLRLSQSDERRRRRRTQAGLLLVVLCLGGALAGAVVEAARARESREQAAELANKILFVAQEDLQRINGTHEVQAKLLQATQSLLDKLLAGSTSDEGLLYSRAVSHLRRGDLARSQGHLHEAQHEYDKGHRLIESLWRGTPRAQEQNLSVFLERLGAVAQDRREFDQAQRYFERLLALAERRAQEEPRSVDAQQALSVCLERLGAVARDQGQLDQAQRYFERKVALDERWAQEEPRSATALRNLSVSLDGLAIFARDSGALDQALPLFERALRITQGRLIPGNAATQLQLLVEQLQLTDLHRLRRDAAAARRALAAAEATLQYIHDHQQLIGSADLADRERWLTELRERVAALPPTTPSR